MSESMSAIIDCACTFCEEFNFSHAGPNRIMWEGDGFVLLPSIGSFTPGYLLLMPRRHVRSFASLPLPELRTAQRIAEQARAKIYREFGTTIVAEHGPGLDGVRSAGCCDHAHWHLIPADPQAVSMAYEKVGGPPMLLQELSDLCAWTHKGYIFLSPLKGVYWVWANSGVFPSQFVRQVCATSRGIGDLYDWGAFPFTENMFITRERLEFQLVP